MLRASFQQDRDVSVLSLAGRLQTTEAAALSCPHRVARIGSRPAPPVSARPQMPMETQQLCSARGIAVAPTKFVQVPSSPIKNRIRDSPTEGQP